MAEIMNVTQIPAPRVPFLDKKSGTISREWYRFLLNLYRLTGGGGNETSLDDLLVGPPPEDLISVLSSSGTLESVGPWYEDQSGYFSELYSQAQLAAMVTQYYETTKTLIEESNLNPSAISYVYNDNNLTPAAISYVYQDENLAPVPLTGVITASNGGTGITSYTVGDILFASGSNTLSLLSDVATGNALISGGVGVAPSWGKIGLTTHVSGVLPVTNGGTNLSSYTANGVVYASSTSTLATGANLQFDGLRLGILTTPTYPLDVASAPIAVGVKSASSGGGGNVRYRDDTGTERYQAGILGSAGNTSFTIYDQIATTARLTINSSGTVSLNVPLPVSSGGTAVSSASITAFNNITGYTASGATGTTSTNLVFSTSPTMITPKATTTIGVGNATPSASGSGISFPATQSASTDANTLDDYEEGTWTPTFTNLTIGNGTVSGSYVKIGRMVHVTCTLTFGTTTSISGSVLVGSLPFSCSVNAVMYALLFDAGFSQYALMTNIDSGGSGTGPYIANSTGGQWNATTPFVAATGDSFRLTGTYMTAT